MPRPDSTRGSGRRGDHGRSFPWPISWMRYCLWICSDSVPAPPALASSRSAARNATSVIRRCAVDDDVLRDGAGLDPVGCGSDGAHEGRGTAVLAQRLDVVPEPLPVLPLPDVLALEDRDDELVAGEQQVAGGDRERTRCYRERRTPPDCAARMAPPLPNSQPWSASVKTTARRSWASPLRTSVQFAPPSTRSRAPGGSQSPTAQTTPRPRTRQGADT